MNTQAVYAFVVLAVALVVAEGKNRNQPHHHGGVLKQYQPGPFDITLDGNDEKQLFEGKPVMKQAIPEKGEKDPAGGAICVQDIDAPKKAVWNQILRMNEYAGKVPKVKECKNYELRRNRDGTVTMKTRQKLAILPGYSYENFYDHKFAPHQDSLVWSLDYEKTSDFDDCAGHWHLQEHPSKPGATRVFYACDIKLSSSIPTPVLKYLGKSALKQATSWVKRESEAQKDGRMPSEFETSPTAETQYQGRRVPFFRRYRLNVNS